MNEPIQLPNDICHCNNSICPLSISCKRYLAEKVGRYSMNSFTYPCDFYISTEKIGKKMHTMLNAQYVINAIYNNEELHFISVEATPLEIQSRINNNTNNKGNNMHILLSKPNQGSTLRLIRYAIDFASKGKSVLFVNNDMNPEEVLGRIMACAIGIGCDQAKTSITVIRGTSPYDVVSEAKEHNFDVVIIDSAYLLTNHNPNNYFILNNGLKTKIAILGEQCTRASVNGRVVPAYDRVVEYMDSISYLEREEDGTFVETNLVGKNNNQTTEFLLEKATIMDGVEVPYLRNA